ncbi:ras and EF-hand domain-containing protein-like isoform X2 [Pocillopora damicornis]|uniref:ras and EF-hand domain-containing protein-like isoform X2 n=1 Tax=Pocillopora damicornis TaxID=46731 RepID=UPI000F55362D|nr:ras and EF-hand domain-containing protein-like isoform X2 [Pocillopora damicornis]
MDSEVTDDIEHTVKDIFRSWDLNKNGFIEKSELACCCAELNLTKQEIEDLFNELDADKDNKISLLDFSKGFKRVCSLFEADVEELSTAEKERKKFDKLLDALGVRELLSGQEYVSDLFHYLHNSSESPQLVALLESFLFSVVRDVKHYSSENQRLEEALKRTCEKHSEHMDQLDNELEQQMQRLESRIRKEEKSKQERSNLDIVWQLENKNKEIQTLTARVQKLEGKLKKKEPEEQKIKEEVDDKVQEIRFLRSQLTDAQTNLAILRSELAQLRNDYEEQESQLTAEKRTVMECVQEQESLTRQLQLLHEANKKLHDTNDDLRAALEARKNSDKRSPSPSKRHSISTLYSPTSSTTWKNNKSPSHRCSSGFAEDFGADSVDGKSVQSTPSQNVASSLPNSISNSRRGSTALLPSQQSCEVDDDSLAGESSLMTELMQVQQLTVPEDIPEEETKSTQQLDYNNNAGILNSRETGQVHHLLPPARQSCEVDDHVSLEDKSLLDEPVILGFCSMNFHRDLEDEDEAYNSLRSSERKSFSKQLDILQETNKRLCDSNDDLRAALEALTGRRSLKLSKARRSGEKCHRNPSIHSDYGSISSRSITPNHLQGPKSEDDVADGAEAEEPGELSGYEPESDVNTMTVNARHFEEAPKLSKLTATPHERHVVLKEPTSDVMWESDSESDPVPAQPTLHQHEQQQQEHLTANVETNANNITHSPFVRNSLTRKPCRHKSLEQLFNQSNSKGDRSAWPPIARAGKWNSMEQVKKRNDFIGERTRSLPTSRWHSDERVNLGQGIGLWQLSEKLNVLRASRESVAELKNDDYKVNVIAASHEPVIQNFNTDNQTIFHDDLSQLVRKPSLRQRIFHDKKIAETPEDESTPIPGDFAGGSSLKRRNSLVIKRNRTKTDSLPESDNSKPDTFSAELEAQFKSVIEEDDEDIDEDDVGDEELAQLVAMARANTESEDDSETEAEAPEGERGAAVGSDSLSEASSNTPLHASVAESNVPERMYKLVLAGDAAVGKSSFILRLCRNRFHSALNSTLGVDFQMKTLVVDDKTIAFQLWDTAGQERFRSIAKSYFRKADGVLLLYDVTCETSFINVRDWVEAIEESTSKPIPIMLCGNKTDLRQSYIAEGKTVITEENGEKLAREYGALFTETSSKENKNITDACIELGRLLRKIEDTEVEQSNGLTLKEGDEKSKKKSCCLT